MAPEVIGSVVIALGGTAAAVLVVESLRRRLAGSRLDRYMRDQRTPELASPAGPG
ncbi:MAG TPA: hypothetical protein VF743_07875 [Acidimicrobiales bacterium]